MEEVREGLETVKGLAKCSFRPVGPCAAKHVPSRVKEAQELLLPLCRAGAQVRGGRDCFVNRITGATPLPSPSLMAAPSSHPHL